MGGLGAGSWQTISVALEANTSGFGPKLAQAGAQVDTLGRKADSAADKWQRSTARMGKAVKVVATGMLAGVGAAAVWGLKIAASNEQAEISFTTMLGSAQKARKFLDELRAFAAATPFEFSDLQTAASSLISVGVDADKVIPIMRSLGDATAGMGTGAEGVKRATVALQQMNAAGKITGEDLNQLRDAGIPVYGLLAAATGKSKAEVVELAQAGKLGAKELGQLMKALESGKGLERFNGLMDKQSRSLNGLISTAKDVLGQGLATLLTPLVGAAERVLPDALVKMQAFMDGLQGAGATLRPIGQALVDFGESVGPPARELGDHLLPIMEDLGDIAMDVVPAGLRATGEAFGFVLRVATPLADGIHLVTSFLADNSDVVKVAAVAWGAYTAATAIAEGTTLGFSAATSTSTLALLANKAAKAGSLATTVALTAAALAETVVVDGLTASLLALATAEVGVGAAMGGAAAGVVAGGLLAQGALDRWHSNGKKGADELAASIKESTDGSTVGGYNKTAQKLQAQADALWQAGRAAKDYGAQQTKWAKAQELDDQAEAYRKISHEVSAGVIRFRKDTGLTSREIEVLAARAGKSMKEAFATKKGRAEMKQFIADSKETFDVLGVSVEKALTIDPKVLKANAEKVKAVMAATAQSFTGFSDVLQVKEPDPSRISFFYRAAIAGARTFTQNVTKAISAGYDPNLLSRIIQAGPEQAGPILEQLVAGSTDAFVQEVNNAETELSKLTAFAVEQARITARAIASTTTGAVAAEASKAQEIAQILFSDNRPLTLEGLAARAGISVETLRKIVKDYDLDLRNLPTEIKLRADAAKAKADALNKLLDGMDGRQVTPSVLLKLGFSWGESAYMSLQGLFGNGPLGGKGNRWGGISEYRTGGIHAHVQRGERIRYAEPSTGGEAFVPRFGDWQRSTAVLREAASWYGGQFVAGGAAGSRPGAAWGGLMPAMGASGNAPAPHMPKVHVTVAGGDGGTQFGDLNFYGVEGDSRSQMRDAMFELGRLR